MHSCGEDLSRFGDDDPTHGLVSSTHRVRRAALVVAQRAWEGDVGSKLLREYVLRVNPMYVCIYFYVYV